MDAFLGFLKSYWKVLTGTIATIALVFKLDKLVEALRRWVALGAVQPTGSKEILLSEAWGWGLALGVIALLASLGFCGKLFLESQRLRREHQSRSETTWKTLQGMIWAANRIANQLYPLAERPPFAFERVSRSYHIDLDGTARVTATYMIRAYERPLHFWTLLIGAEPQAIGVDFLEDIQFKIQDEAGADRVAYLLRRNDSHHKEISVFFLPLISPQEGPRKIIFSYTWPSMLKRLLTIGDEEISLLLEARIPVAQFEYAIYFCPKLHNTYTLECQQESAKIDNEVLQEVESKESGYRGWRYAVDNAPAAGHRYQWRIKATRK